MVMINYKGYIPDDIYTNYEVYEYKHAAAILSKEFPLEFSEICEALRAFRFKKSDVIAGGGNESEIPKIMSRLLRPKNWLEKQLEAELTVYEIKNNDKKESRKVHHGTHKVDYVKGRIALDLEWNSKDQTFDRDLYAFRAFFEYDAISVGIIITRSTQLNPIFRELNVSKKYGASTTHMGKLLPRLEANRNGGCPVLVFGITPNQIEDLEV
jgi:hypothetical protein